MSMDDQAGKYLFKSTKEDMVASEKTTFRSGLIAILISVFAVLVNSNSISADKIAIFGSDVSIRSYIFLKLMITSGSILSGLVVVFFAMETISHRFRIRYLAEQGVQEALLLDGFDEDDYITSFYKKIKSVFYPLFLIVFVLSIFLMPVISLFYFWSE